MREAANRSQCQNNVKQLGLANQNYASAYQGSLPNLTDLVPSSVNSSLKVEVVHFISLLPYLEESAMYAGAIASTTVASGSDYGGWYGSGSYVPYEGVVPKIFLCPSDSTVPRTGIIPTNSGVSSSVTGGGNKNFSGWAAGSYAASQPLFGSIGGGGTAILGLWTAQYTISNIPDGTSNTLSYAERYCFISGSGLSAVYQNWANMWWYPATLYYLNPDGGPAMFGYLSTNPPQIAPTPATADYTRPQTAHIGGMIAGLADGSVRIVSSSVSTMTWGYALAPADGNSLPSDW